MALNPLNSSNLEQLASKGLIFVAYCALHFCHAIACFYVSCLSVNIVLSVCLLCTVCIPECVLLYVLCVLAVIGFISSMGLAA